MPGYRVTVTPAGKKPAAAPFNTAEIDEHGRYYVKTYYKAAANELMAVVAQHAMFAIVTDVKVVPRMDAGIPDRRLIEIKDFLPEETCEIEVSFLKGRNAAATGGVASLVTWQMFSDLLCVVGKVKPNEVLAAVKVTSGGGIMCYFEPKGNA